MKHYLKWLNRLLIVLLVLAQVEWFNIGTLAKDASVLETIAGNYPARVAEAHTWTLELAQQLRVTECVMVALAVALVIGIYTESKQHVT